MYCGIDEAGRGSVMGPLVVGSVFTESDDALIEMGVKDSKKLSPGSRERIFALIEDSYTYNIVVATAAEIDERRKRLSLNVIELDMFAAAAAGTAVDTVFADCPDINTMCFASALSQKLGNIKVIAEHKADDTYPAVSAASIVAKVTRDRMIEDIKSEFGIEIGSGYPSDRVTMEFIEKWIKDYGTPPKHTRCSWEPIKHMMSVSKNTKISDW